jgi:Amt family ammonium transporter
MHTITKVLAGAAAAGLALPALAAPSINKGDTAWMFVSTLLVIMMAIPGLALFYGGLVRAKNMLSVLMQVFMVFSLIIVLWCLYGYSLAFTQGNAFIGGFDRVFLNGIYDAAAGTFSQAATFSKETMIPEFIFVAFQGSFAATSPRSPSSTPCWQPPQPPCRGCWANGS